MAMSFPQSRHSVLTLGRLCLFFEPQFVALQMGTWTTCLQRPQPEHSLALGLLEPLTPVTKPFILRQY